MNPYAKAPCGTILRLAGLMGALWAAGCQTLDITPSVSKNYTLRPVKELTGEMAMLRRDGEESLRVDEITMFTSSHPDLVRWREHMDQLAGLPPYQQVEAVNNLVNRKVSYLSDDQHWDKQDTWGFPLATAGQGGDCEDYAVLKGVCLHYLNWPSDRLFLLLGQSTYNGKLEHHAVLLVVLPDGSQLVLDSQEKRMLPPAAATRYTPMLALNKGLTYTVGKAPASDR